MTQGRYAGLIELVYKEPGHLAWLDRIEARTYIFRRHNVNF